MPLAFTKFVLPTWPSKQLLVGRSIHAATLLY